MLHLRPRESELHALRQVALGRTPPDRIVTGGTLINVFTEELLDGWGLAIYGGRIAAIGPEVERLAGSETQVINVNGDLICPGLVEPHTHLMKVGLTQTIVHQVRAGVTTSFIEMAELAFVSGAPGFRYALAEARTTPGRAFLTVPPLFTFDPDHDAWLGASDAWVQLLELDGVAGVGEVAWHAVAQGHRRAEALIAKALAMNLTVEGHGAGARLSALGMLAASGVASDHEGINASDVETRLRLGFYTLARHGATRLDLDSIASVWDHPNISLSRLALATDGIEASELQAGRSLNWVVDEAVARGLPVARAVRMATHTPAERFGVGRDIGALAPGMLADVIVVPRGERFIPRIVLVGGEPPRSAVRPTPPEWLLQTVQLPRVTQDLVQHPGPGGWRAMDITSPLITHELMTDGHDSLVACSIDRLGRQRAFRGLIRGFGISDGAVALSSGWDATGLTAVGDNPSDLMIALNRVEELNGGAVVASQGRVLAEWRAELAGVQGTGSISEIAERVTAANAALRSLGCALPNPLLSLEALTSATIPHLRIWPGGYVRLKDGARLGLAWE